MRRFRFRLQRLLDFRRHIEREWEFRLAEKEGVCQVLRNGLHDIHRQRVESFLESPTVSADSILDLDALRSTEQFRARLEQERARLERELAAGLLEQEELRRKYVETSRDRKVLDRLKEKQEEIWRAGGRKEEERALDEIASQQTARREERID